MDRILYCLTVQHDWRWTVAAALTCVLGLGTAFHLLSQARNQTGAKRSNGVRLGALVGGLAIFSTHFIAMQGFQPGGEVRYGVWLTLASLGVGMIAIMLASNIVVHHADRLNRALAAAVGLTGTSAMHFLGIAALDLQSRVAWDPGLAATAVAGTLLTAVVAAGVVLGPGLARLLMAAVLGAGSIVFLHFVAMSALILTPDNGIAGPTTTVSATVMLGVILAMLAAIVAVAGIIMWMGWISRSSALTQIREAIDAMPDGLAFYDSEDRLVLWNSHYDEVNPELSTNLQMGMAFRDIIQIGLDRGLYLDALGREAEWVEERLSARRVLSSNIEQRIAGGRWLRVSDRRTAAGGIVTVSTDITDLKNTAAALAEARDAAQSANTAKSQFLANMSHEIRTPLNGVIGLAQALAKTKLTVSQSEMLELIQSSGHTLQALLSDILDLARVESGRLTLTEEVFDLGRAVREAARLYEATAHSKGLQFFVEITPQADRWIVSDMVRLKQILTNLISNAVKFTSEGFVKLTVSTGPDCGERQTLRFSVEDTGIGFDRETRDRLFSRFEQADGAITRRFGGSGLGLAISRQLATIMGGDLECESETGGGSTFILTVPFRPAEVPEVVKPQRICAGATEPAAVRVLVADDHPVNRKVVEMILGQTDVVLTAVDNGAQALAAARAVDFDIILMDMQMPVMDGLAATREIRLYEAVMGRSRTPIVMLTANALPEHIAAAEAAGADRHLAKPFDAAELLDLITFLPREALARETIVA